MKKGTLKLHGTFCGACTFAIEKAGRKLKEVEEIRVNPGTKLITVTYDGDRSVLEKIKEIAATLGHDSEITHENINSLSHDEE